MHAKWMGFWMRPEALSARVSLGVTSLLTLFYQHSKSQESLPRVSYFKMLDVFMLTSTIFVFMGLVELCLVIVTLDGFEIRKSDRNQSVAAPKNNKVCRFEPLWATFLSAISSIFRSLISNDYIAHRSPTSQMPLYLWPPFRQ